MKKTKNGNGITETILKDMARFYLKKLFYGIPEIPVDFSDKCDPADGTFILEKASDYDPDADELINAPEYRWRYLPLSNTCGIDVGRSYSWEDPLNHPQASILIRQDLRQNVKRLTGTLLHELLHYYCWHAGYDFSDGDRDFEDKCKEMGIPSNYSYRWTNGEWKEDFDGSRIEDYIKMYVKYLVEKTKETVTAILEADAA